jgi:uncharacterized cupin superfamily protein
MVDEARLEEVGSGLAPVSPGWFVVNASDAAWVRNEALSSRCVFEGSERVLAERPDVAPQRFAEIGVTLAVLEPGKPSGLYHAESAQEDFLVLAGECLLLVEGEERRLQAWDFVHCPPHTEHIFVGAGDGPCVIFMAGGRTAARDTVYVRSDVALRHGAGAERETGESREAYAPFARWTPGPPASWDGLPWALR